MHDSEKIAVVGRNGCGKTTLLKLIAGDIQMSNLDSDEECGISMAGKQEIGFLRQWKKKSKRPLHRFLPVRREWLKLSKVFIREKRMFVYCLSMTACRRRWRHCGGILGKQALEQMLQNFQGTVLFVSHDRYFMNQVATGILEFGISDVKQYHCGYEEYLREKERLENVEKNIAQEAQSGGGTQPTLQDVFDKKTYYNPGKIKSRLVKQLEKYEKQLADSEEKAAVLQMQLMNPALASDYEKLMEIQNALEAEEHNQETLLERMLETETQLQELE